MKYRATIIALLVITVAMVLVYGQAVNHVFLNWDDYDNITKNERFNPVTLKKIGLFWQKPYWGLYIPATYTLFGIESYFATETTPFGTDIDPALFHTVSIVMQVICVWLVFFILRRFTTSTAAACLGALLFGLHPIQVESVCWVTEQRGMLSHVFGLSAVALFLGRRSGFEAGKGAQSSKERLWYGGATLLYALALLSKPSAVSLPLMILVLIWLDRDCDWKALKRPALWMLPWVLIALIVAAVSKIEQPDEWIRYVTPLHLRPFVAGDALSFYISKTLLPYELGPDYGRSPTYVLGQWWGYVTWIPAVLILGGIAWADWRRSVPSGGRRMYYAAAAALFFFALAPVLGFIPFNFQDKSTVGDRYMYLAMLGPALAAAVWVGAEDVKLRRERVGLASGIVVFAGVLSFLFVGIWKDHDSFYANAMKVNGQSSMAHNNLGTYYLDHGFPAEAIALFYRSHLLEPRNAESVNNLVSALLNHNRHHEAVELAEYALELDYRKSKAHINMGMLRAQQGRVDDAIAHQREAIRLEPSASRAYNNLGADLMTKGETQRGLQAFANAVMHDPRHAMSRRNYAIALRDAGHLDNALQQVLTAEQLQPGDPLTYESIGSIFALMGRYEEAVQALELSLRIDPSTAHFLTNALEACRQRMAFGGWR